MFPRRGTLVLVVVLLFSAFAGAVFAQSVPDSLWIGTDNRTDISILNVTKSGATIRSLGPQEGTGLAISPATAQIAVSTSASATIQWYFLSNLSAAASLMQSPDSRLGEDMAYDGTSLYRVSFLGGLVYKVNTSNGAATQFIIVSRPLGVAFSGTFFYVSQFNTGKVIQFDLAGAPTGLVLTPAPGPLSGPAGGLAWDTCTSTLWLGSSSRVYNIDATTGAILGSFATPDTRFVDGLEYQGGGGCAPVVSVPVPTLSGWVLVLLGALVALTSVLILARRSV